MTLDLTQQGGVLLFGKPFPWHQQTQSQLFSTLPFQDPHMPKLLLATELWKPRSPQASA